MIWVGLWAAALCVLLASSRLESQTLSAASPKHYLFPDSLFLFLHGPAPQLSVGYSPVRLVDSPLLVSAPYPPAVSYVSCLDMEAIGATMKT